MAGGADAFAPELERLFLLHAGGFYRLPDDRFGLVVANLVALNAVYSVATAFFQPARTGLTPQLLEPRLLMSGNGAMATAENLIWMIGFACGGLLVAWIGVGWAIATFLVVPVLAARDIGPIEAIKESASLLRRTWGENLIGQAGLGLAFGLIFVGVLAGCFGPP